MLLSFVLIVAMSISSLWRRPPIDDAYITYRYAANLIAGNGLLYNVGEWVLGTTTPLWAALLALAATLGCDIEVASIVGGVLAAAVSGALFLVAVPRDATIVVRALWAVALVLYYPLAVVSFSGMETSLYTAVVGVGLFCFGARRVLLGTVFGLVATLLRPDGVLVILAGLVAMPPRLALRSAFKAIPLYGALLMPVLTVGFLTYGEVWPHSVAAKRLLYPASIGKNILFFFEALSQTPVDALVLCVGVAGLVLLAREATYEAKREVSHEATLRPFLVWGVLYAGGIIASGVKPLFFWYFGPLWLLFLTFGVEGVRRAFTGRTVPLRRACALGAVLLLLGFDLTQRVGSPDPVLQRENAYRAIVSEYGATIAPHESVLLGETGILGYGVMHASVIDSCGLVSPAVSEIIADARSRVGPYADLHLLAPWLRDTIERFQPAWVIGARARMGLMQAEQESWFSERYERVKVWEPEQLGGIALYRRRALHAALHAPADFVPRPLHP